MYMEVIPVNILKSHWDLILYFNHAFMYLSGLKIAYNSKIVQIYSIIVLK